MGSLWQFFGLPDPEAKGGQRRARNQPASPASPEPPADAHATPTQAPPVSIDSAGTAARIAAPLPVPEHWAGPVTPDGEPFHDLGHHAARPPQPATTALRYVAPDEMKRIHTGAILQRVNEGDTVIVDLRPLVHMESHQMACRRELKHACDQARINAFALDNEDKLLMLPGVGTVVDAQKHRLGLQPLM
jgi:hypothetical protein